METAASTPSPPRVYLTAEISPGGSAVWQWVGTDGADYSPVLTDYKTAVEYPEKHGLEILH